MSVELDTSKSIQFVEQSWKQGVNPNEPGILQYLCDYISIPNQSPQFDPNFHTNGYNDAAINLLMKWAETQYKLINNLTIRVVREEGRTPIILAIIPGTDQTDETVLLYGHMDKQPPMTASWSQGLGPFKPVIRGEKLYGRGGADDGYSIFAALSSIALLQQQNIPHSRCVVLIEACEESGSRDLPYYIEKLSSEIGTPNLVICLDSGCGNYEQLWLTTSLRGMLLGTLNVKILNEAVHSGAASGIVPSSFRILRELLDRIEDSKTGKMLDVCYTDIPEEHQKYAEQVAETLGETVYKKFNWVPNGKPDLSLPLKEHVLNNTWRPTLSVTGIDGLPNLVEAGNVLRTHTTVKISIRLPPTADSEKAAKELKETLEANPPYGAQVMFNVEKAQDGLKTPKLDSWLYNSLEKASTTFFDGRSVRLQAEGGSIPFLGMLGQRYPNSQFFITGVLGPGSNAHAGDEFLHIFMAKRLTCSVASVLADHYKQAVQHKKQKI